jgi:hypothetical protein
MIPLVGALGDASTAGAIGTDKSNPFKIIATYKNKKDGKTVLSNRELSDSFLVKEK